MPKIRGYSSYRGRGPFWKLVLSVLLVAVILASVGILTLQRRIVYDAEGVPRIEFSWQKNEGGSGTTQDGASSPDHPDVEASGDGSASTDGTISGSGDGSSPDGSASGDASDGTGTPEGQDVPADDTNWEHLHVYAAQAAPLTTAIAGDVKRILVQNPQYNALSVRLKDEDGWVFFPCPAALGNSLRTAQDTGEALRDLTSYASHSIARIACFHDSRRAQWDDRTRLRNTGGYIFYDGNDTNWMDPAKADARAYLCALAAAAAEYGFDEILLTDVGYPTEGKLNKIAYGEAPIGDNLSVFLEEMRAALAPYHVTLTVEVPKSVLLDGGQDVSGISLDIAARWADRICAQVEPDEIAACNKAVAAVRDGAVSFLPELHTMPDPAPVRYLLIPFTPPPIVE